VMLTCHPKVTEAHQTWLKVQTNSFNDCLKTYV